MYYNNIINIYNIKYINTDNNVKIVLFTTTLLCTDSNLLISYKFNISFLIKPGIYLYNLGFLLFFLVDIYKI